MRNDTTFFQPAAGHRRRLGPAGPARSRGIIFAAHGAQKLFGWFGGYGLEGTGQWMDSIGLTPGYLMALSGRRRRILRRAGAHRRLAGAPDRRRVSAVAMVVAIFSVHIDKGLFVAKNGYEFALALLGFPPRSPSAAAVVARSTRS